jgi:succinoglycan biosynthesis protein ExoM
MSSDLISRDLAGLAIGACTYKRRSSLIRLLEHIAVALKGVSGGAVVIIVDNDGHDPAVEVGVTEFAQRFGITARYIVETQPGISAARNAVFAEADRLGVRFVAMIDDDEWPSPHWLSALLAKQAASSAVVVGGPVSPVFPDSAVQLRQYARYWSVEKQLLNGKPFVFCTCNFLIDLQPLQSTPRPLFDEAFGLSGGGDTVFFRGLFFAGHAMAWADDALVYEEVPESRASFKESMGGQGLRSFVKTLGLTARLLIYPLFRREPESPFVGWLLEFDKVRGRYASHFGDVFVEYARPQDPGEKACR